MVLGLVADLFFSARIRETAKQLGVPCDIVRDPEQFLARAPQARLAIVDMNLKGADAGAAVRAVRSAAPSLRIIGFLHDVQEELMLAAEQAGCSEVLSRGQLTRRLADLLR